LPPGQKEIAVRYRQERRRGSDSGVKRVAWACTKCCREEPWRRDAAFAGGRVARALMED